MFVVDTNVLVYRHDAAQPGKQAVAERLLRRGLDDADARLPYQALVEFVPAVTKPRGPLMARSDALREVAVLAATFPILYPSASQFLTALEGCSQYGLPWFDACIWSYAQFHAIPVLYSEDFQHGRRYGDVVVLDPFRSWAPDGVAER